MDEQLAMQFSEALHQKRIADDICENRHRGSETSVEANPTEEAKRESHQQIIALCRETGRVWLKSVCRALGKEKNEVSGRLSELKEMGVLMPSGDREEKCAVLILK